MLVIKSHMVVDKLERRRGRIAGPNYGRSWITEEPGPSPTKLQAMCKAVLVFNRLDNVLLHLPLAECEEMAVWPLGR